MIIGKAFYVETLKCASLSLVKACKGTPILTAVEHGILPENNGETIRRICLAMGRAVCYRAYFGTPLWNKMFTFSFVRNPWSRAVALWRYFTEGRVSFEVFVGMLWEMKCRGISEYSGWDTPAKLHTVSQWHNLSDGSNLVVNRIWKMEDGMDRGFAELCDVLGIQTKNVPIINKGKYREPWRTFYTDETREKVGVVYSDDVEHFGYKFEESLCQVSITQ